MGGTLCHYRTPTSACAPANCVQIAVPHDVDVDNTAVVVVVATGSIVVDAATIIDAQLAPPNAC